MVASMNFNYICRTDILPSWHANLKIIFLDIEHHCRNQDLSIDVFGEGLRQPLCYPI